MSSSNLMAAQRNISLDDESQFWIATPSAIGAITTMSLLLNGIVCFSYLKGIRKYQINRILFTSTAVCDILQSLFGAIPEIVITVKREMIREDNFVCVFAGFFVFSTAIIVISHFTFLAFVRWLALCHPFHYKHWLDSKPFYTFVAICVCYLYGFFWPALVFTSWSKYTVDLDDKRCSLDWKLSKKGSLSYIIVAIFFCYGVPGVIIIVCTSGSFNRIRTRRSSAVRRNLSDIAKRNEIANEYRFLRFLIITTTIFFIIWIPYAVVGLIAVIGKPPAPVLVTVASMLAKLSGVTNPIAFCFAQKPFRRQLFKRFSTVSFRAKVETAV